MNTTKHEKTIKSLFVGKCWEYLNDNFHKFTQDNKIKIALALASKDTAQEIKGQFIAAQLNPIKLDDELLDFKVGASINRIAALTADGTSDTVSTLENNGHDSLDADSRSAA